MAYQYVILEKEVGIYTLTLNRPERLNALNDDVNREITAALDEVERDAGARVFVLTGAGRAFCAGGDFRGGAGSPGGMAEVAEAGEAKSAELARKVRSYTKGITLKLQNLDIPTIASVNGPAVGAGFCMALACDMRLGSDQARFQVAWTLRGLVTAFGSTWLLPRIVGLAKANELIFTARMVESQEALQLGLLNKLVPAKDLKEETRSLAGQIAKGPPLALRLNKLNIYKGLEVDFNTALEMLASSQAHLLTSEDFVESARAFQEKREPVFRGR